MIQQLISPSFQWQARPWARRWHSTGGRNRTVRYAVRYAGDYSRLLGVGEPLIYGVTLPRMKPFVTACLGGAAGGLFIGLIARWGLPMGLNSAFGPSGLVALPLMTSAQGILPAMAVYAGGILVAWVCGFIFTTLFGTP